MRYDSKKFRIRSKKKKLKFEIIEIIYFNFKK